MAVGKEELENRFGLHKATLENPANPARHAELRKLWMDFAKELDSLLGDSRAKSVAFTELETASMWTHKALAATPYGKRD